MTARNPLPTEPDPRPRRLRRGRRSVASRLLLPSLLALLGGCGHVIEPGVQFEPGPRFDFRQPPCGPGGPPAEPTPDDGVAVRYLGASGLFVGWRGEALLTGPFLSNPGYLRVGFGRVRADRKAIARGLEGIPLQRVGAILVGHSHYDHLGDVPIIAQEHAPNATVFVNRSGRAALEPYRDKLGNRLRTLEEMAGTWQQLSDAAGKPLPFRVLALPADHAPHFAGVLLMHGEVERSERPWKRRRYWSFRGGRTYAFVLDLLDSASPDAPVRYRILYQDSAGPVPTGLPPGDGGSPYDLAVVCMPSAHLVPPYPQDVLGVARPGHVLVTHYEDFFERWGPNRGFVPVLGRERADRFLRAVDAAVGPEAEPATGPKEPVCGPSAARWTMPLVGEWMVFPLRHRPPD